MSGGRDEESGQMDPGMLVAVQGVLGGQMGAPVVEPSGPSVLLISAEPSCPLGAATPGGGAS